MSLAAAEKLLLSNRNVGASDRQEAKRFQDKNRLNIQRADGVSQYTPLIRGSSPMSIDTQSLDNEIIGPADIQVPATADR